MMETIRTAANSIVVKIIFGIIILAFIFTGVGGFLDAGSSADDERLYIAKVDGEGISRAAFEREAQIATQNSMTLGGGDSFQKMIRRSVLSNQIDNYLSYKFSETLNSKISDEQVKNMIRQQTVFFEKGKFSNKLYLELLNSNGYTPDNYAEALRGSIQQQQVIDSLLNTEFILPIDSEILELQNQERTAYITTITADDVIDRSNIEVTEEQARDYYDSNTDSFFKKEGVKLKYIRLNKLDFENEILIVNISDKEAEDYYKSHKKDYVEPLMHSYHFIELDDKVKAEALLKELVDGANFAKKVKEFSLSPSMSDMGWFAMNDKSKLPQFIADANLSKKGQLSLIEDNGHYIILKLDSIVKEKQYPFSLAAWQVKVDIWRKTVDTNYNNAIDRLKESLAKEFKTIDEIAEDAKLQDNLQETEWNYFDEIKSVTRIPDIKNVIFDGSMFDENGSTGKVTDIIHTNYDGADYVLQVTDYHPEGIPSFDVAKDNIINQLTRTEIQAQFKDKVIDTVKGLNNGESFDFVEFAQKSTLTRDSKELDERVRDMVFSLIPMQNKDVYGSSMLTDTSATIAVLVKTKVPEIDTAQKESYIEKLQAGLLKNTNYYLLQDLRSRAKIEMMPNADL